MDVPKLDPAGLRAYVTRDWQKPERLARAERARRTVSERSALGIALYESTKTSRPDWPTEADRRADLETHLRVKALMWRARHVGAR